MVAKLRKFAWIILLSIGSQGATSYGADTSFKIPKDEFIGFVETPKIMPNFDSDEEVANFKPKPIKLYDSPDYHSPAIQLTDRDQIFYKGLGLGWVAAPVYELKNGFFKIFIKNKFVWLSKEDGADYQTFDQMMRKRTVGITVPETWNRKVFSAPNKTFKELPAPETVDGKSPIRDLDFVDSKTINNHLWFKFKFKGPPCSFDENDGKVVAEGWVRAFEEGTGKLNVWILAQGC